MDERMERALEEEEIDRLFETLLDLED